MSIFGDSGPGYEWQENYRSIGEYRRVRQMEEELALANKELKELRAEKTHGDNYINLINIGFSENQAKFLKDKI